jgi:hypothetical protein
MLYFQPCAAGLFWNQEEKICDRGEKSLLDLDRNVPQTYQVNYGADQKTSDFIRPTVPVADQSADRQQGYRYRNYSPYMTSEKQM